MDQLPIPKLKTRFARERRKAAARCERDLWHQLRAKRLDGWKFKREAPIGPYVVDFACFEARLVVEADGPLHSSPERQRADWVRESWLRAAGYRVVRFSDEEILSDLGKVLDRIRRVLRQTSSSPGSLRDPPSPSRGEGGLGARHEAPPLPGRSATHPPPQGGRVSAPHPSPDKMLVIACGALAREIGDISAANGLDHIELRCLPALLHNEPHKIPDAVRGAIRQARTEGYERIAVGYADCGTGGLLDKVCAEEGVERIAGPHCYSFYWGNESFAAREEDDIDAFFLTDFLARQFESFVIEPLGLDRHPELRDMYFGNYRRLIFLAQKEDAALEAKARAAAGRLGLKFEMRKTGMGDLAPFLTTLNANASTAPS